MKRFIQWIKRLFKTEHDCKLSELEDVCRKQQSIINALMKKDSNLTFLPLPDASKTEEYESYLREIHLFYSNRWVRSFFANQERELLKRFKSDVSHDNGDFFKGGFVVLESIRSDMQRASMNYEMTVANREAQNASV